MRFGMCKGDEAAVRMQKLGAEYIELSASNVYKMEEDYFKNLRSRVNNGEFETYSCNGLVIPDLRLTGDEVDFSKVREYAKKAFNRLAELKIIMLVFGSSKAKHVPEGFSREKAWDQLFEVGHIFSEEAKQNGQTIAVEPLRYAEVNIVNTVEDGAYYVKNVNQDNYKLLADFYHLDQNKEDINVLEKYKDMLVHIHIANPQRFVLTEDDKDFTTERIELLKKIGYKGNVSFEGDSTKDEEKIKYMLNLFKEIRDN